MDGELPGVVAAVAHHGRVVYRERFGMMDVEAGKQMQFDTIFRIYSMTEALTNVVVNAFQAGVLTSEGEYGWGGAAGTRSLVDPKEDLIGLMLT